MKYLLSFAAVASFLGLAAIGRRRGRHQHATAAPRQDHAARSAYQPRVRVVIEGHRLADYPEPVAMSEQLSGGRWS